MYIPVPKHVECLTDTAEELLKLGDERLYLMHGLLNPTTAGGDHAPRSAEVVILERGDTKVIVEVDGYMTKAIAGYNVVSLAPLRRASSIIYKDKPRFPPRFRDDVAAIFSSPDNPFKLVDAHVQISDPDIKFKRGYLADRIVAFRLEDGTSVDALRVEVMIAARDMCVVGVNNRLVASFPANRLVGVARIEPSKSAYYQHFTL